MWLFIRGIYYNMSNVSRVKVENDTIVFFYKEDAPTIFYNATKEELELLMKELNNEY